MPTTILNKKQFAALGGFTIRVAEILVAGCLVYGIMQPVVKWGVIVLAGTAVPGLVLIGVFLWRYGE